MHRWNLSVLATAALLSAGLYATDANALALGRLNVQSALGEPLRAEIDLPQITPAEADSLRVAPASPDVFRAQGAEYSPAAHSVQIQLQRRPDGSMYLRLSSARPINEPFVDLVIDANWSSGHIVRSYTMLLDPPALRRPQAATAAPQFQPQAPRPATPAQAPARTEPPVRSRPAPALPAPAPAAAEQSAASGEVTVRSGDTAGRIAAAHRPAGASLDQMLVAMMRSNPDAFIDGNVNRLRAGTVLQLPDAAQAQATPAAEARRIVAAQSRDFNEFRRRLAQAAPSSATAAADRSASGSVQTQVQDSRPAQASPDKLTLSKGSVSAASNDEKLAQSKQASQDAQRMAELSRNISELNQLSQGSASSTPSSSPSAAAGTAATPAEPAAPASAAGPLAIPATGEAAPVAPPTSDELPDSSAAPAAAPDEPPAADEAPAEAAAPSPEQPPAPAPTPAVKPPPPPPPQEPSFFDFLTEDPLLAGGALALLLALIGYGGWRVVKQRRANAFPDSSIMDSRKGPDTFFDTSGGQRVDTAANSELSTGASSSMTYSPSQLDAGDVDPVAEADVYLAYGRDLQAEEILKEALRHYPDRVSIPVKLAEIHAKRQDRRALEVAAGDVLRLTGGKGPDWSRVAELGRSLDPTNSLYQPGAAAGTATASAGAAAAAAAPAAAPAAPDSELPDLDLDLDFDLDLHEAPATAPPPSSFAAAAAAQTAQDKATPDPAPLQPPAAAAPAPLEPPQDAAGLGLELGDLDLPGGQWEAEQPAPSPAAEPIGAPPPPISEPSPLDLDDIGLTFTDSAPAPLEPSPEPEPPSSEPAALEFDLGDLTLDLGTPSRPASLPEQDTLNVDLLDTTPGDIPMPDDPLATKLALAEEFNAIGDSEGARSLVEEVIAESSGDLRARAQRLLATLS